MDKIKIAFFMSEASPYIKTGGLADVCGSLPQYIDRERFDIRLFLPGYSFMKNPGFCDARFEGSLTVNHMGKDAGAGIFSTEDGGVTCYFIKSDEYFGGKAPYGEWKEDIIKFCFYEKASLIALKTLGWRPDIIHCHDWQAALTPCYIKEFAKGDSFFAGIKTVLTIHNLRFQGRWGDGEMKYITGLPDEYFCYDGLEYFGDGNMLKGGIEYCDKITTVSETYSREILTDPFGEGLSGTLYNNRHKLQGIVNGIDGAAFSPECDSYIRSVYSAANFRRRKPVNKKDLQAELGLPEDNKAFMMGMVTRLTDQKGMDIFCEAISGVLSENVQLVVLGTGESRYEEMLRTLERQYPGKVRALIKYSDGLSHKIYAASDAYLMPSLFEPCGLSQLIALKYGTVPIVRETGGLKDTVVPYNKYTGEGTGFSFANYDAADFQDAVQRAFSLYKEKKAKWNLLCENAMKADWSWKASAEKYREIYQSLTEI